MKILIDTRSLYLMNIWILSLLINFTYGLTLPSRFTVYLNNYAVWVITMEVSDLNIENTQIKKDHS